MAQLKDLIVNGPSRFIGDVYATTFTGNLAGNATSATSASSAGNASTVAGLSIHSGRNNEANKIVRTDGNGYLQVGYINSSSGWSENNNSSPDRVWGSNASDSYLRAYRTSALSVGYATNAGTAVKVGNALTVTLNGGTTEGTNKFTYDGSGVKSLNITPSIIGAANASHTHNYIPITGGVEGEVEVYSIMERTLIGNPDNNSYVVIREDMCGPNADNQLWLIETGGSAIFESIAGKLVSSLAIKLNGGTTEGTNLFTFNNSASKTINITPSAIGAAAASHTHTFASLTSKPTTISGYGITDAYTKTQTDTKFFQVAGGAIKGSLTVNGLSYFHKRVSIRSGSAIDFYDADGNNRGILVPYSSNNYALSFYDTTAWRTLLHSGNYNSYSPKLDGTGASGTWRINISGSSNYLGRTLWPTSGTSIDTNFFYTVGQLTLGTSEGNAYEGSSNDYNLFSFPSGGTSTSATAANIMNLRLSWDKSKYWHDIFASPNDRYLWHRNVYNGTALDWNRIVEEGNNRVWGINISGNADTVDGYHAQYANSKPWGTIPAISPSGYMDVGKSFEFHYDNTTGLDYSTILACTGNHKNLVNLPSASGTLALVTDNVASATKLATSRTIWGQSFDGTGNVSGALTGVTDITASGHTKVNSLKTQYICIECDNSGNTAGHTSEINHYSSTLYLQYSTSNNCCICYGGGNVGIGTTSPSYKLHIAGVAYASEGLVSDGPVKVNESFVVDGTNGSWYGKLNIADEVYILGEDTNINFIESLNIKQHNTTNNTETSIVSIDNSGNITLNVMNNNGGSYEISTSSGALGIGIPSDDPNIVRTPSFLMSNRGYIYINASLPSSPNYPLVVNGTIQCTTLSQTSDIKYKTNIKQIEYEEALKIIENLNPVTWDWNENTVETGSSSGFVAQEAEKFIPNAISRDNENNLSLDYTQLHSYEIRVIQEQQKEIIKLKEKLKILENLIS